MSIGLVFRPCIHVKPYHPRGVTLLQAACTVVCGCAAAAAAMPQTQRITVMEINSERSLLTESYAWKWIRPSPAHVHGQCCLYCLVSWSRPVAISTIPSTHKNCPRRAIKHRYNLGLYPNNNNKKRASIVSCRLWCAA